MENLLRKIPVDDEIVVYKEESYESVNRDGIIRQFERYKETGKLRGQFEDRIWIGNSDIKTFQINFNFNEVAYFTHMKPELGLSVPEIRERMKCFAVYICGEFIYKTIAKKINLIKRILTKYGNPDLSIYKSEKQTLIQFLAFISLGETAIDEIMSGINIKPDPKAGMRELAKFINYLAIDNELTDMYTSELSDEEFLRWFPIFFWCKVTFLIPLRATEMLVTPCRCIERRESDVYISLRRTRMKKGKRSVFYDVDKDYHIYSYRVPDNGTIKLIEKYIELTKDHDRRFLFDYTELSTNGIFSLSSFNNLIEAFVKEKLVGNQKYDFARHATRIKEFSVVSAGDSRPIAMSNIYYSDCGAEICRQLADHTNLRTSYGYYMNIANTVEASSIMKMQSRINDGLADTEKKKREYLMKSTSTAGGSCDSPRRPKQTGDIRDCIKYGHFDDDCFGCPYHNPSEEELQREIDKRRKKFEKAGKAMLECIVKGKDTTDIDKILLTAHTGFARYRTVCDERTRKEFVKWERYRDSATT